MRKDKRRIASLVRNVAGLAVPMALKLGGVRVESHGADHATSLGRERGFILVANHSSNLDPMALIKVLGRVDLSFVAKAETLRRPLLGELLAAIGWFQVERQSMAALKKLCEDVEHRRKSGWVPDIVVFPEGTRSTDGKLAKFQIGPFLLAAQLGLPIVPAAIHGAAHLHPKNDFRVYPGTIRVEFGKPLFPPEGPLKPLERVDVAAEFLKTTEAWFRARLEPVSPLAEPTQQAIA